MDNGDFDQFLATILTTPANDDVCAYDALLGGEMPRFHVSMPKCTNDDDWLSWRLAAPTRRALLVQLGAPRSGQCLGTVPVPNPAPVERTRI